MGKGTNISFGIRMNCSFREIKLEGGGGDAANTCT